MRTANSNTGIVLYTVDAQFAESALRAVSSTRSTRLATSLIKVMNAVEKNDCSVLVTDISADNARLQKIISALKQLRPELVTIVVSDSGDTTDMVQLINHGQIFRFLKKPVMPERFKAAIEAAIDKSTELRTNPDTTRRHKVSTAQIDVRANDSLDVTLRRNGLY